MLAHTLEIIASVPEVEQTLVISRDPAALALAREHKAKTVQEEGSSNLNTALRRATFVAKAYASDGILILPADLPLLKKEDL
jgi:2-phospho-L-lactate guanylyltransferase (CobY/MobA/RfbA family)